MNECASKSKTERFDRSNDQARLRTCSWYSLLVCGVYFDFGFILLHCSLCSLSLNLFWLLYGVCGGRCCRCRCFFGRFLYLICFHIFLWTVWMAFHYHFKNVTIHCTCCLLMKMNTQSDSIQVNAGKLMWFHTHIHTRTRAISAISAAIDSILFFLLLIAIFFPLLSFWILRLLIFFCTHEKHLTYSSAVISIVSGFSFVCFFVFACTGHRLSREQLADIFILNVPFWKWLIRADCVPVFQSMIIIAILAHLLVRFYSQLNEMAKRVHPIGYLWLNTFLPNA